MVQHLNERSKSEIPDRVRRRSEARRLEILRAAAATFRERGFASAGMREIAEQADLSAGNLYHYFEGKNEILFFCQDRALDRMQRALEEAGKAGGSPADRLARVLEAHVVCILDDLAGGAAHLEVHALPAELRDRIVAKRDRYERAIRGLVARGIEEGEFSPGDPDLLARAMLGAVNWSAQWFRSDGRRSARSVGRHLAAYLVRGLLPGDRSGGRAAAPDSGGTK
jgi:AcrR family transcriptional regulator